MEFFAARTPATSKGEVADLTIPAPAQPCHGRCPQQRFGVGFSVSFSPVYGSILRMNHPLLRIQNLCQIAIVVRDIEAAAQAYAKLFGVPKPNIVITDTADKAHTRYHGQPTQARAKLAFFQTGPVALELIEPIGGPSTWREVLDKHGPCIHHIAFRVENMDRAVEALEACGIPTVQRGDFTGGCYTYCDGGETLGAMLELLASTAKK